MDYDIIIPNATPSTKPFVSEDVLNGNTVEGIIHTEATAMYGALEIEKVNGRVAKQTIWCTPKMGYPYCKDGSIRSIAEHNHVGVYLKYDGTNIFGFVYHDADGKEFISYKTRLMPFLKTAHKFGDFLSMWKEMLAKYPQIPSLVQKYRGVSFEMYGKRNPIIIQYSHPLDTVVLFAVPEPGKILSPEALDTGGVPKAEIIKRFDSLEDADDFKVAYDEIRAYLNANLKIEQIPAKSKEGVDIMRDLVYGLEGSIWYLVDDAGSIIGGVPVKCKPDYIFDLCTAGGGIPTHSIRVTILNALEQDEPLTYALVKKMLLEEYTEDRIEAKAVTIRNEIEDVLEDMKLLDEIGPLYVANKFDIAADKGTCMRFFGPRFPKKMASKVYTLLLREFGGK